eukprot:TRINITY_DN36330_c0_g1_i1.p1 TRINITY_DN36330_c0_g1~~TRINITY_DN36330_c0_g1_i1.p1  ORF type:complete len:214 (-),score=29.17 TRINITY_DN36330_c0_g1_i1:16-657(-)
MADQRFNFNEFFNQFKLFDFLGRILADPDADPDILVEAVGLAGNVAADSRASAQLTEMITPSLIALALEERADPDLTVMLLYCFHNLVHHKATRMLVLSDSRLIALFLHLLDSAFSKIRLGAQKVIDTIADVSEQWGQEIRQRRFAEFNREWILQAQEGVVFEDEYDEDEDHYGTSLELVMQEAHRAEFDDELSSDSNSTPDAWEGGNLEGEW